jgi:hypothetical protein
MSAKTGTIEELSVDVVVSPKTQKKLDLLDLQLKDDPNNVMILLRKGFYFFMTMQMIVLLMFLSGCLRLTLYV